MTALGEVGTVTEIAPALGLKMLYVVFPATAIGGTDTVQVDLNDFGCTKLHGIEVYDETTAGSIVVAATPTTVVTSGVLVITLGGSATSVKSAILYCT